MNEIYYEDLLTDPGYTLAGLISSVRFKSEIKIDSVNRYKQEMPKVWQDKFKKKLGQFSFLERYFND